MLNKTLARAPFISLLIVCLLAVIPSKAVIRSQAERQKEVDFSYVVVKNIVHDEDNPEITSRQIILLMDEKAFTEKNLEKLSRYLLKKYPKPNALTVWINTNLEQVATPEEEGTQPSESAGNKDSFKYHLAILFRYEDDEYFNYTIEPRTNIMKTIVLKGKAPRGWVQ